MQESKRFPQSRAVSREDAEGEGRLKDPVEPRQPSSP